jgi:hypothetical protein
MTRERVAQKRHRVILATVYGQRLRGAPGCAGALRPQCWAGLGRARGLWKGLWVLTLLLTWHPSEAASVLPGSLCRHDEAVVFSCPVQDGPTLVSLCMTPQLTLRTGYIQYRFGQVGSVELEFPEHRHATQAQFRFAQSSSARGEQVAVSFETQGSTYTLFDYAAGVGTPRVHQQGLQVTVPGVPPQTHTLVCRRPALGSLRSLRTVFPVGSKY